MQTLHHDPAIDAQGLGKRFGIRWVLRGVTFRVHAGEAVGLLGENGSGKSTVLRILGTLLRPNAGSATVSGVDVVTGAAEVRDRAGYLAHTPGLYEDLTARENLIFSADMLGVPRSGADASLDRVGLAHASTMRVRGFSAGMQRRLALARLIMRRPKVLLLDEPYSNLDESGVALMNSVISEVVSDGGAALLALHELAPSRNVLARTISLVDGRIAADAGSRPVALHIAEATA